jgi:hypothetical protein
MCELVCVSFWFGPPLEVAPAFSFHIAPSLLAASRFRPPPIPPRSSHHVPSFKIFKYLIQQVSLFFLTFIDNFVQ